MTSASEARALLHAADAQREALRAAVEVEALPVLRAAWEASPGRLPEGALLRQHAFMRVGLVERKTDVRGTFDLVWLDTLAYRPFGDDPELLLLETAPNTWVLTTVPDAYMFGTQIPATGAGPVWIREKGLAGPGYPCPWVHLGVNVRSPADEGRVDHAEPSDDVERLVYPAAAAWVRANGGPA
jgi:hypothetical protein